MGVLDWRGGGGLLRPSIRLPDGEERMRAEIPQFSQFAQPPLPLFVSRVWGVCGVRSLSALSGRKECDAVPYLRPLKER